jgi:predicted ATPase
MIQKISIENFKAIYKAVDFPVQPFTVFIGNNGTGKSTVIEALRVLQMAVNGGLNTAFEEWGGLDRIRNYNASSSDKGIRDNVVKRFEPLRIGLTALVSEKIYEYKVQINVLPDGVFYVVESEELYCNNEPVFIAKIIGNENNGTITFYKTIAGKEITELYRANRLRIGFQSPYISEELEEFTKYIYNWQFLYLNAHTMGKPVQQDRVYKIIKLDYEGRNIADYLMRLKDQGVEYLDNIIRKMRFVLPYISNIEPHILEETINREIELLLYEANENSKPIPGWLLSSGTLRILALLAMFEAPIKPSVLFVDEVENGLDPRTIGLLLSQVESVFLAKSMQVIFTTHSPYFLDLVPLENIIVAEKDGKGSTYHIPANERDLNTWKEKFSPGKLYTMGKLTN